MGTMEMEARRGRANTDNSAPDRRTTIPAVEARQGRWGTQVLYVLIAGMALAALAWFIAERAV